MILKELIERSPIRIFEKSIHGGLKAGEIGVIASPAGVGKTSVLVQLALDKLLQDKKIIHVSFSQHIHSQGTHYVLVWYEDIFNEFISRKNLENAPEIKSDLVKNRVLMSFNQDGITVDQAIKSLKAMVTEGGFKADMVIVDGFDFAKTDGESIASVKAFAKELGISIWFSCSVNDGKYSKENIPAVLEGFIGSIDIVIILQPKHDHIELSVSKDRDSGPSKQMAMSLDPKTLLILEK